MGSDIDILSDWDNFPKEKTALPEAAGISEYSVSSIIPHNNEAFNNLLEISPGTERINDTTAMQNRPKKSSSEVLIGLVTSRKIKLFPNEHNDAFISFDMKGHTQTHPVESKAVKLWLNGIYYKFTGKTIGADSVKQVIAALSAKAIFEENLPKQVYTRIARDKKAFWYDLSNPKWQAVKITPSGWSISDKSDVHFRRFGHQEAQVQPSRDGDLRKVLDYVPLKGKTYEILFLVWLVSTLIPGIPRPMPIFYGEKGAAKTTTCEFLKSIIDPSMLKTLYLSKDMRTLAVNFDQHLFLPFDNLSYLSDEVSDMLSRAITGGGIQQRTLFTNADDTVFSFQKIIALNGINNVATRPDLLDRSVLFELERIPEEKRAELSKLQADFEESKPIILGGILDILSKAMCAYPDVELDMLPRMADFTRWGYAIAEAIEKGAGNDFLAEYEQNRKSQNDEAIRNDPLATLLVVFMQDKSDWSGTPTELYSLLKSLAHSQEINTSDKSFPKDPARLSRRLNGIKSNLEAVGIHFNKAKSGERNIELRNDRLNPFV